MFRNSFSIITLASIAIVGACSPAEPKIDRALTVAEQDSINRAHQDSVNRAQPGYIIDSILPIEEQLNRFRNAVGGQPVAELQNASKTRDALVGRFIAALHTSDSTELRAMVINAREFADLVYPESPSTRPPYRQDPGLMWTGIQNPSGTGFRRLLRRMPAMKFELRGYACDSTPTIQGKNRLWTGCRLDIANADGKVVKRRWFGSIIERDQRFKIISYRNEL